MNLFSRNFKYSCLSFVFLLAFNMKFSEGEETAQKIEEVSIKTALALREISILSISSSDQDGSENHETVDDQIHSVEENVTYIDLTSETGIENQFEASLYISDTFYQKFRA